MSINETKVTLAQFADMIDHSCLAPNALPEAIERTCREAVEYGFHMVAINSVQTEFCAKLLKGTRVHVGAAIAFPLGQCTVESKMFETADAIEKGADEIDYVLNIPKLIVGDTEYIRREMEGIVSLCREAGVVSKVIFENCFLTKEQIVRAAQIACEVRPDFIKTSTGFGTGGATAEDVLLMKRTVGDLVKVKAAGGIRTAESFLSMVQAGAERIGTSASIRIIEELRSAE